MLKCQYCDRDLKTQGAKNLHERACKNNPQNSTNEIPTGNSSFFVKCDHNNKIILLNPNDRNQKRAIDDGYSAFCSKCKDLI